MTSECKTCKRRYKILCSDGNCYYCFTKKHGKSPYKVGEYGNKFTRQTK